LSTQEGEAPAYPAEWEADVLASDGGTVHVRPIRPDDAERIDALHRRLSTETIYLRFFAPLPRLSPTMLERLVHVDYADRFALVAELGDELVAVARYDRLPGSDEAEVAFLVEDAHQGRGLGSLLLEHLAAAATASGIRRFVAETLPENQRMLQVFRDAGYGDERRFADGVVQVSFDLEPTAESIAQMRERERRAAARSVARLLRPATVAVVGAGRSPSSIGRAVLRNLLAGGFEGPVYPVNPHARSVQSVPAWASVKEVPDALDLAIVSVPANEVPNVVAECATKRVGGLVVISSGFSERDEAGAAAEAELVRTARRNGMRVIGPNCMGVVNTDPAIRLNASLAPEAPLAGSIGVIAQSGTLGIAIVDELRRRGLGVSTFVSAGNKADVSSNDLLQYWEQDEATKACVLYIESFGNPRTFARIAPRIARTKPVLATKGGRGRSPLGDEAVRALFQQAGVLRFDALEPLLDTVSLLVHQPLPAGGRVALLANAGGAGTLAADAAVHAGLDLAELGKATHAGLDDVGGRVSAGLVELGPEVEPAGWGRALATVLADSGVDAVVVSYVPTQTGSGTAEERRAAIGRALAEAASGQTGDPAKPVLANFLAWRGIHPDLVAGTCRIPSFAFPEAAMLALARALEHARWLSRPPGRPLDAETIDGLDLARVRSVLDDAERAARSGTAGPGARVLDPSTTAELADALGLAPEPGQEHSEPTRTWPLEVVATIESEPELGPVLGLRLDAGAPGELFPPVFRLVPVTVEDLAELIRALPGHQLLGEATLLLTEDVLRRLAVLAETESPLGRLEVHILPTVDGALVGPVHAALSEAADEPPVRRLRRPGAPSWPLR
jgi:acyl-CoA synthetase (NDP forming)/RimJ/RimL family protein N-acetyltransferase